MSDSRSLQPVDPCDIVVWASSTHRLRERLREVENSLDAAARTPRRHVSNRIGLIRPYFGPFRRAAECRAPGRAVGEGTYTPKRAHRGAHCPQATAPRAHLLDGLLPSSARRPRAALALHRRGHHRHLIPMPAITNSRRFSTRYNRSATADISAVPRRLPLGCTLVSAAALAGLRGAPVATAGPENARSSACRALRCTVAMCSRTSCSMRWSKSRWLVLSLMPLDSHAAATRSTHPVNSYQNCS